MGNLVTSRCNCGQVTARATGEPLSIVNCHCTECRRATGAAYGTVLYFPVDAVETAGRTSRHDMLSDQGNDVSRHFCPFCGSQRFVRSGAFPNLVGLRAGTLEDTRHVVPQRNVFTASKIESTPLDPDLPVFPEMP